MDVFNCRDSAVTLCVYPIEINKSPKIITSTVDNDISEIIRFPKIESYLLHKSLFLETLIYICAYCIILFDVIKIVFNATFL